MLYIPMARAINPDKQRFLRDYVDYIAKAGLTFCQSNSSTHWWLTKLASKNHYSSDFHKIVENIYFNKLPTVERRLVRIGSVIKNIAQLSRVSVRLCKQIYLSKKVFDRRVEHAKAALASNAVYVIKTFGFQRSFKNGFFEDLYFGPLKKQIEQKIGAPVLVVFDPVSRFELCLKGTEKESHVFPYQAFLHFSDIFKIWSTLSRAALSKVPRMDLFYGHDLNSHLRWCYQKDVLSKEAFFSVAIQLAFRRLLADLKVSQFILTAEFNPWERLVIEEFRRAQPSVRIVGYQHSIVMEDMLNMFPGKEECQFAPKPDVILTTGRVPFEMLKKLGDYRGIHLEPACALRYTYLDKIQPTQEALKQVLLAPMEGTHDSAAMLDYLVTRLKDAPDWQVIVRPHPAFPISNLLKHSKLRGSSLPKNFSISSAPDLTTDITRSSILFYWGSTTALECLKAGHPLIQFDAGVFNNDPLVDFKRLKWTVKPGDQLLPILGEIMQLELSDLNSRRAAGEAFVNDYFWRVTDAALGKFYNA